jgi:hypothetical protein
MLQGRSIRPMVTVSLGICPPESALAEVACFDVTAYNKGKSSSWEMAAKNLRPIAGVNL